MQKYSITVNDSPLEVFRFQYEPVDSNMFFIPIDDSGFIIDPNVNEDLLLLFKEYGTTHVTAILTHEHYDHISGVKWLQEKIDTSVFCQKECAKYIFSDKENSPKLMALVLNTKDMTDGGHRYADFMASYKAFTINADETFTERKSLTMGIVSFECFSTPGHSPGSACYILANKYIFTGDSLIQNTPTILCFRTSDKERYKKETLPFLKSLDKEMIVFPGHGDPFKITEAKYL